MICNFSISLYIFTALSFGSIDSLSDVFEFDLSEKVVVAKDSIEHPAFEEKYVYLFRPAVHNRHFRTIFFCHGIDAYDPDNYKALILYMVKRGFAVIYSPYPGYHFLPGKAYKVLWQGFEAGAAAWKTYLDFEEIGFVGHSYGASAVPSLAYKAINNKKWGKRSAFIYIMAPWYIHNIRELQLRHYPSHVKLITEVFEDDKINDHRIAKELHKSIRISDTNKVFLKVMSNFTGSSLADHDVPLGYSDQSISVDDYDYCSVYYTFNNITDYAFSKENKSGNDLFRFSGERIIDVRGSQNRIRLHLYKDPPMQMDQEICVNFWNHSMNPRLRLIRLFGAPLRSIIQTPATVVNYGILLLEII